MEKIKNVVYLYFQKKISEHTDGFNYIDLSDARKLLTNGFHTPKNLTSPIFKEMERLKLIKLEGKYNNLKIKIINENKNKILDNPSRLYHFLGLF